MANALLDPTFTAQERTLGGRIAGLLWMMSGATLMALAFWCSQPAL